MLLMNYSLFKISFGTSKKNHISDIDIDANISDICYATGDKFIFASDDTHCLGLVEGGKVKFPWIGRIRKKGNEDGSGQSALLNAPISVCLNVLGNICVVMEDGGSRIREIEIEASYASSRWGASQNRFIDRYFSKIKKEDSKEVSCAVGPNGHIYWVVGAINRCFKCNASTITNLVGNGHAGYSVSNNLQSSLLNGPSGVCSVGKSIYISDKGNGCIRKVSGDSIGVIYGNPLQKKAMSPSKIVGKKNVIYFIGDGKKVKYLSMANEGDGNIYESEGLCSICLDEKNNLFVLERK